MGNHCYVTESPFTHGDILQDCSISNVVGFQKASETLCVLLLSILGIEIQLLFSFQFIYKSELKKEMKFIIQSHH